MPILTLQRRLREVGRIRLGIRVATANGKKRPAKLDRFRFTSRDQQVIEAAAAVYGGTAAPWDGPDGPQWEVVTDAVDMPVVVPPGEMSFSQWYETWSAGGCQRRCDGVTDYIADAPCSCDPDNRTCSITSRLSLLLPEVPGFGLWRVETHGYYAATELGGVVELCQAASRAGHMLPARLRLEQRSVKRDGKTNKFAVPVLDLDVPVTALGAGGSFAGVAAGSVAALADPAAPDANFTPVGELPAAPAASIADQVADVNTPAPRAPRKNAAAPIPATAMRPRTAAEAAGSTQAAAGDDPGTFAGLPAGNAPGDNERRCVACGEPLSGAPVVRADGGGYRHRDCPEDSSANQPPAGDPQRSPGDASRGITEGEADAGGRAPAPANPSDDVLTGEVVDRPTGHGSPRQRAMFAKVGDLVRDGIWDGDDADRYRKGVITAVTAHRTDSSNDLSDDELSDVLDALDGIAAGRLTIRRRATGQWSIDVVPANKQGGPRA